MVRESMDMIGIVAQLSCSAMGLNGAATALGLTGVAQVMD